MYVVNFGYGVVLFFKVNFFKYDLKDFIDVLYIEIVVIYNEEKDEIIVFVVNRDLEEEM